MALPGRTKGLLYSYIAEPRHGHTFFILQVNPSISSYPAISAHAECISKTNLGNDIINLKSSCCKYAMLEAYVRGFTACIVVTAGTSNAQLNKKFCGLAVCSHLALSTVHSDGVQLYQHCQGPGASISLRESILQTCSSLKLLLHQSPEIKTLPQ